jgi:dTDP-glucose 4,6-dehydratase
LVTGGAGFVGSWLCDRLIADGAEVVCVDSLVTGSTHNIQHLEDHERFSWRHADICEPLRIDGPVDVVFHLASIASPVHYLRLPLETLRVGSAGTTAMLELAAQKDARLVLASTSEVYGDPLEHPQHESYWGNVNPVGPRSVYDESKRFSEAVTAAYRRHRGTDTAIARIFNTYGPRMSLGDGRVVPTFIAQALRGEPLTVAGDGSQTRSLCWVGDTVDGLVRLASSEYAGPVNLGAEDETTVLELARTIIELTRSPSRIEFVPLPEDDPRVRCPDTTAACGLLGWQPRVSAREGLTRTIEWMSPLLTPRASRAAG